MAAAGLGASGGGPERGLCLEASDNGPGIRDPLAGYLQPRPGQLGRRGLWLARLLCDRVETRTNWTGTVVRLRIALDGADGPAAGEATTRA